MSVTNIDPWKSVEFLARHLVAQKQWPEGTSFSYASFDLNDKFGIAVQLGGYRHGVMLDRGIGLQDLLQSVAHGVDALHEHLLNEQCVNPLTAAHLW